MKKHPSILTVLILAICTGYSSCKNQTANESKTDKIIRDTSAHSTQETNARTTDSSALQKEELAKIYTHAIATFIQVVYKRDKTSFDTLYFGKHVYGQPDDFPDIELPTSIENTPIRLVSPELGQKLQAKRKSLVYINMMGWVDKKNAEFFLVTFSNGGAHQYDYFINFIWNASTNQFELDKIEFENYIHYNGQKPKRITVYQNGKYAEHW